MGSTVDGKKKEEVEIRREYRRKRNKKTRGYRERRGKHEISRMKGAIAVYT